MKIYNIKIMNKIIIKISYKNNLFLIINQKINYQCKMNKNNKKFQ